MHKGLLAILLLSALAFSGCSGKGGGAKDLADFTCPDGTILTSEQLEASEGHHDAGFNATSMCPVAPKVKLAGLPASVMVYRSAPFTWSIDPGSVAHGHSMITEIRYSNSSVPDSLASITTYGKTILKKEHQDLPVTFKGNMTFTTVGKVYVRAYAAVQGEKFDRRDVWGPEVVLNVLPVNATGVLHTVTHKLGPVDALDPANINGAKLGDEIKFANDDVPSHTFELDSAPAGAPDCQLSAPSMGESASTCMFTVPGAYEFVTDDVPTPKRITVNVAQ